MEATPPPFFKRGPSPAFRLGVFGLLAVALMVADARLRYLEPVRQGLSVVLYPLQQIASAPGAVVGRIADFFGSRSDLQQENAELKTAALKQAAALQELDALKRENEELRALLQAKTRTPPDSILAEVLYKARDPFSRKFIVDKGMTNDIKPGVAVVDGEGVIGQVTRVYPFVAEVTQINDKDQAVPIQNVRTGLRAIVFGNGKDGTLDLRFMPINADVQVGDVLVTSGIDGVYPPGLSVARVTSIDRNAALPFARITCDPLGGVDRRGHVLVLAAKRDLPARPVEDERTTPATKSKKGRKASR